MVDLLETQVLYCLRYSGNLKSHLSMNTYSAWCCIFKKSLTWLKFIAKSRHIVAILHAIKQYSEYWYTGR